MDNDTNMQQFAALKKLLDNGLIDQKDYDEQKQTLLSQITAPTPSQMPHSTQATGDPTSFLGLEEGMEVGPDHARFVLEKKLGCGGMACVWKAQDFHESERHGTISIKALKFLHPDFNHNEAHFSRLKLEADHAKKLRHPHIVGVYGFEQDPLGHLFLIMDYLEGSDLAELLIDEGGHEGLSWPRVQALMQPVA